MNFLIDRLVEKKALITYQTNSVREKAGFDYIKTVLENGKKEIISDKGVNASTIYKVPWSEKKYKLYRAKHLRKRRLNMNYKHRCTTSLANRSTGGIFLEGEK